MCNWLFKCYFCPINDNRQSAFNCRNKSEQCCRFSAFKDTLGMKTVVDKKQTNMKRIYVLNKVENDDLERHKNVTLFLAE